MVGRFLTNKFTIYPPRLNCSSLSKARSTTLGMSEECHRRVARDGSACNRSLESAKGWEVEVCLSVCTKLLDCERLVNGLFVDTLQSFPQEGYRDGSNVSQRSAQGA